MGRLTRLTPGAQKLQMPRIMALYIVERYHFTSTFSRGCGGWMSERCVEWMEGEPETLSSYAMMRREIFGVK